jgi:hypothetical protein
VTRRSPSISTPPTIKEKEPKKKQKQKKRERRKKKKGEYRSGTSRTALP